ncbi:MAG: type IV toxin-antitoxin system AbiEi family antitoxin [Bacteroidales bacterium]|jgi:predicted transcriptional regulator of viral defense system
MINKHISTQSHELLNHFIRSGRDCFDFTEALSVLPASNVNAVKELLSDMVRRGLLMRLNKGLYYLIPYEKDAESFMPDWHLVAGHLARGAKHYIGYYSALQIHNPITQPSLKEQIVVSQQFRPSVVTIKAVDFQFIYHNENHFFGYQDTWIDSFHKVSCSDLEKTLIDCLFRPDYAGGIGEIARALYQSKGMIKFDKLLDYAQRFNSQAVIKRLGFLLELMGIESQIIENLRQIKTASYVLLDTELPKDGKLISRWSIQQNLESETITSALYT